MWIGFVDLIATFRHWLEKSWNIEPPINRQINIFVRNHKFLKKCLGLNFFFGVSWCFEVFGLIFTQNLNVEFNKYVNSVMLRLNWVFGRNTFIFLLSHKMCLIGLSLEFNEQHEWDYSLNLRRNQVMGTICKIYCSKELYCL